MTRTRRLLLVGLVLLFLLLVAVLGGRAYLASRRGAAHIAARLQKAYGGPITVQGVDVGVSETALHGVSLYEEGAAEDSAPWLTIGDVQTDLSLGDLVRGRTTPHSVTLLDVAVTLRLDKDGKLLTQFPTAKGEGKTETIPTVHLVRGKLTVHQEGRPTFVFTGVNADLTPGADGLTLSGTAADPTWGDWSLSGGGDLATRAGSVSLATRRVHVTRENLEAIPFVPEEVWKQVQAEGDTAAALSLRYDPAADKVHYRVQVEPHAAAVDVMSLALRCQQTHGKVIVDDGLVRLEKVHGQVAGGEVSINGALDFRTEVDRFRLSLGLHGLDVQHLPPTWKFPHSITGRLNGEAGVWLELPDGKVRIGGTGQATITDAHVAGFPTSEPIRLKLHIAPGGFEFSTTDGKAELDPPQPRRLVPVITVQQRMDDFLPARAVRGAGAGIRLGAGAIADLGIEAIRRVPHLRITKPQPDKPHSYLDTNLALQDVDVEQLLRNLKVTAPFPVAGKVSVKVQASIPLDVPDDPKAYRLHGTATSKRLRLAGLEITDATARVSYVNGVLRLEEFKGKVPHESEAGTFAGNARLQMFPSGDLTAELDLAGIPLARVLSVVPGAPEQAGGTFSGTVKARGPASKLRDPAAWDASGNIRTSRLDLYGLALEKAAATFRLERGLFAVTALKGEVAGAPVAGSGDLRLTAPFRYEARLQLGKANLGALQKLAPEFRPPVEVAGQLAGAAQLRGTLNPPTVEATGTASGSNVVVEGLHVGSLSLHWDVDKQRIKLTDVRASLYDGSVTGSATLPLEAKATGRVEVDFQGVDVAGLTRDVKSFPIRLEGKADGSINTDLGAAPAKGPRPIQANVKLEAPKLRVQGVAAEKLTGTVTYQKGAGEHHLTGQALGGRFELEGKLPPLGQKPEKPAQPEGEGRLSLRGAQLSRLGEAVGAREALSPLGGVVDLTLTYQGGGAAGPLTGKGRFLVRNLRWGSTDLSGSIASTLLLSGSELRFSNLQGDLAGGVLGAQLSINLRDRERSWFTLSLDNAESARLLAPCPDLAKQVSGAVDARVRGSLGREWRGSGAVDVARGRLFGAEFADFHLPVDFSYAPSQQRGELHVRDAQMQIARGRANGRADFAFGGSNRLDGQVRCFNVDLRTLLRQAVDTSYIGAGRASGRLDFGGNDIRSVDDLTGRLEAALHQTQALEFPVLKVVAPFVLPGQPSLAFDRGDIRAILSRGVVRVQRLALSSRLVQLFAEGTVTLTGRLNLEVTATTGCFGANPAALRLLGLRIPAFGPIPLSLLLEASTYLSNRTIHLRVSGTVRSPTVRIEPVSLFSEEAVRFLINRANIPIP